MLERADSPDPVDVHAHAEGLKVHLRVVTVARATYRIITLRPATTARFSANYFHDTWHVLTDREGAFVLARLLWGLAFQREPGTVVLLDGVHLVPTPFEAEPADPILLVPAGLTRVDADLLRRLKRALRRPLPQTTVRWHTFGLPRASGVKVTSWRRRVESHRPRDRMRRVGGFLCYSAPADILRSEAEAIDAMRRCGEMAYHYLASEGGRGGWRPEGEVQVFRDFRDMVSSAVVARRAVLGGSDPAIRSEAEREEIQHRAKLVEHDLREARRRAKGGE